MKKEENRTNNSTTVHLSVLMALMRYILSEILIFEQRREKTHQENMSVQYIPLKPHFYIVKLGFAGVYLFFLFLLQNIDCGYSLDAEAVLTCTHNLCFEQK